MHTNSGVPGLSSYPAIHYFVPALTKRRCWGAPYWHFCQFSYLGSGRGCLGTWSSGFLGRMVAFSSSRHRGSLATVHAPLGAGPFIPVLELGGWGVYFVHLVIFEAINNNPPAPADVQVTHTTPTQRLALYAPLVILLGHWGTRHSLLSLLSLPHCWFWGCIEVDSTSPRIRQCSSHANSTGPQASTIRAAFCIVGSLGTGGCVWGVVGVVPRVPGNTFL
jgi:hypothetical protein